MIVQSGKVLVQAFWFTLFFIPPKGIHCKKGFPVSTSVHNLSALIRQIALALHNVRSPLHEADAVAKVKQTLWQKWSRQTLWQK